MGVNVCWFEGTGVGVPWAGPFEGDVCGDGSDLKMQAGREVFGKVFVGWEGEGPDIVLDFDGETEEGFKYWGIKKA